MGKKQEVETVTALRYEAIQLVKHMPEDQMPYVIQYIHDLKNEKSNKTLSSKMKAFQELEQMLIPVELDYDKELSEARENKYGHID